MTKTKRTTGRPATNVPRGEKCAFCEIVRRKAPAFVVAETTETIAFLDHAPLAQGHTLVVPIAHHVRVEDLSANEAMALFAVVHRLARPVATAVGATASTIVITNGYDAGQRVPHVHVHLIPRHSPVARRKPGRVSDLLPPGEPGTPALAETAERIRTCMTELGVRVASDPRDGAPGRKEADSS